VIKKISHRVLCLSRQVEGEDNKQCCSREPLCFEASSDGRVSSWVMAGDQLLS
jgi:hypothetical protein